MRYLIAKGRNSRGCYVIKLPYDKHFSTLKKSLSNSVKHKGIQLVSVSSPMAYGEYAPYHFVNDEKEFEDLVLKM